MLGLRRHRAPKPPPGEAGARAAPSRESGFALIEQLVVVAVLGVVVAAILSLGETTQRIAPKDSERAFVIRETQVGLHRMTKELRQSHALVSTGTHEMDVRVLVGGTEQRVRYNCSQPHPTEPDYRRCLRYVGTSTTGEVVIDRVLAAAGPVFSYVTNAQGAITYVEASVEVPARGDLRVGHRHRVALHDGFWMRNFDA
jgi:competence protein ComGC